MAAHGGFADDDTQVLLLRSNPRLHAHEVAIPVTNAQIAPTTRRALDLQPRRRDAVRAKGTRELPAVQRED